MQQKSERYLTFFQRLLKLKCENRLNWDEIAQKIGVSRTMIHYYKVGKFEVSPESLYALEKAEMEYGIKTAAGPPQISATPKEFQGPYYGMNDAVPLISWASAGTAHAYEDQGHDVPMIKTNCRDHNGYALQVEGNSMEPVYQAGDILIIAPNYEVLPNDLVMLRTVDEESYFKRYLGEKRGVLRFQSFNPNYPVMEFRPQEIEKMQAVWSVLRLLKENI